MSKIVKKYMGDLTNNNIPVLSYGLTMNFEYIWENKVGYPFPKRG